MVTEVLVLPGGGYRSHAPHEAEPVAEWFAGLGVRSSVLRYPLGPHPMTMTAVQDRIAASRAAGVDKLVLAGFSAGGHAAALAALRAPAGHVDAVVLGYPVVSFRTRVHAGSAAVLLGERPTEEEREQISLDAQVASGAPPFFVFHARDDSTVPVEHSLVLSDALQAAGVDHELHLYARGGHGGGLEHNGGAWRAACVDWLRRHDLIARGSNRVLTAGIDVHESLETAFKKAFPESSTKG